MNEKQKILKMVEEGKITAQDALELIEALGNKEEVVEQPKVQNKVKKKMFRIRIDAQGDDHGKGKAKVNVNIPISVAKKLTSLTKVIPESAKGEMEKEGFNIDELNLQELLEAIEAGDMDESIIDIEAEGDDGEGGAKVKIYVD